MVFDSRLVSRTRPTYVLEVLQSVPPRLAPYHLVALFTLDFLYYDTLLTLLKKGEITCTQSGGRTGPLVQAEM